MQVPKRAWLLVLVLSLTLIVLEVAQAVQVRDDDDVKFIQDLPDTRRQTFVAAAATMDECSEPTGV